jgi:H+/Cl- antiporter ClcA
VIPFGAVLLKTGGVEPVQNAGIAAKFGAPLAGVTVTFSVCGKAHCPAFGVNVYMPLVVLLIVAGLHVPEIPLGDVFDKIGGEAPAQNAAIAAKLGVTLGAIVTVTEAEFVVHPVTPVTETVYTPGVVTLID